MLHDGVDDGAGLGLSKPSFGGLSSGLFPLDGHFQRGGAILRFGGPGSPDSVRVREAGVPEFTLGMFADAGHFG